MGNLPSSFLARAGKCVDDVWKKVDAFRALVPEDVAEWDRRVFLPLDGWMKIIEKCQVVTPGQAANAPGPRHTFARPTAIGTVR